jgi:transcriptional regulator GlxA family with amidase domain
VAPLVRELLLHARRWPIGRSDDDPVADRFFVAMADVVRDALESERPLMLPTSPHPVVVAIADHVRRHIDTVTVTSLARAVGVSERTLRRLCRAELGVTCRDYLLQARLLQAMVLLAQPDSTVLGAATAVGFSSGSAFARVFAQRCGEAPAAYARRTRGATSLANRST